MTDLWRQGSPGASTMVACANSDNLLTDMFELLGKTITLPYTMKSYGIKHKADRFLHETKPLGSIGDETLKKISAPIHQAMQDACAFHS